ncbi:unnamed protein product [Amoebophrya sp. A120]|nr:unnamed protein product [Amoebophrya sp. A120]|eukprot:GSA120T00007276001.1
MPRPFGGILSVGVTRSKAKSRKSSMNAQALAKYHKQVADIEFYEELNRPLLKLADSGGHSYFSRPCSNSKSYAHFYGSKNTTTGAAGTTFSETSSIAERSKSAARLLLNRLRYRYWAFRGGGLQ